MKLYKLALTASALAVSGSAFAAVTLTSAAVTGPTGTVWNTAVDGFYTLFLQNPFGNTLNPNDNFGGFTVSNNPETFDVAGDGWPLSTTNQNDPNFNSDPYYDLTLTLSDGTNTSTITGRYTVATDSFASLTDAVLDGNRYSIASFDYNRSKTNRVGSYSVASANALAGPGSKFDYLGTFGIAAAAVPEPATWAMMIGGFGFAGVAARRRRRQVRVTYA